MYVSIPAFLDSESTLLKDPVTRTSSFALSCLHAHQPTLEEIVDLDLHFSWVVRVSNCDRRCGCTHLLVQKSRYAACQVFRPLSQLYRRNMCCCLGPTAGPQGVQQISSRPPSFSLLDRLASGRTGVRPQSSALAACYAKLMLRHVIESLFSV